MEGLWLPSEVPVTTGVPHMAGAGHPEPVHPPTWRAALQKAGCSSARLPHQPRSAKNLYELVLWGKRGHIFGLRGNQPAHQVPGGLAGWPAGLSETYTELKSQNGGEIQCVPVCLLKDSSALQTSIPPLPRDGCQQ